MVLLCPAGLGRDGLSSPGGCEAESTIKTQKLKAAIICHSHCTPQAALSILQQPPHCSSISCPDCSKPAQRQCLPHAFTGASFQRKKKALPFQLQLCRQTILSVFLLLFMHLPFFTVLHVLLQTELQVGFGISHPIHECKEWLGIPSRSHSFVSISCRVSFYV